jgi:hypothetical protein
MCAVEVGASTQALLRGADVIWPPLLLGAADAHPVIAAKSFRFSIT